MARSIVLNLIGNNRTSGAFRGVRRDADETADSLDRLGGSAGGAGSALTGFGRDSGRAGGAMKVFTGRVGTITAGLLTVAPAAQAAAAAAVAGAGAMAAAYGSAAAALGAFGLAAKGQLTGVSAVADAQKKAEDAVTKYGKGSEQAAKAQQLYAKEMAKLPPATRDTAKAFLGLKKDYQSWSDSLAGDTMPVFTKGINIARSVLPKLTPLVKTASAALSDFMDSMTKGAKSKGFAGFLGRVNDAAKVSLPAMLRSVKNVGVGIAGIFDAFLPHSGKMASGIEGLTAKFAAWGRSLKTSDTFKNFIGYVRQNLPALQVIFGNLLTIFGNLMQAMAPVSGVSLEIVKGFTGILAAMPPELLKALATGFIAVSLGLRILNPLIRVFNILMRLNPVGIVVLALAGLAYGLYTAYKRSETFRNIVNAAWRGVQGAVSSAWTKFIRPALSGLRDLFSDAARVWQEKWPALKQLLTEVGNFFSVTLAPAVGKVVEALGGIGSKADEAAQKLGGVGQGFDQSKQKGDSFLTWSTGFGAAIGMAFAGPLGAIVGAVTVKFWPELKSSFAKGWSDLKTKTWEFAQWLGPAVARGWQRVGAATGEGLKSTYRAMFNGLPPLRSSWSGFWTWTWAFAKRQFDLIRQSIGNFLSGAKNAFNSGVDAIGRAWRKIQDYAKKPVNFMIGTVYEKGIRGLWNNVMDWLRIDGMRLGHISMLKRGGTLDNPAPAKPFITNGPTAIVGEGRKKYPEYVIPTDPAYRSRAQGLWAAAGGDLQMLASGGVLGGVLGGIKRAAGKVVGIGRAGMDLLDGPEKIWDKLAGPILAKATGTGEGPWNSAIGRIPAKLMDVLRSAAMSVVKAFAAGFGGDASGVVAAAKSMLGRGDDRGENNNWITRAWGMPGAPWCAMFVSEAIKKAGATKKYKGYPTAAVAGYAGAMRHVSSSEGRPGDLGAYRGSGPGGWAHINVIEKRIGGSTYATIGGNEGPVVKRGQRTNPTILRPMARGGVLGVWQQANQDPADRRDPFLKALRAGPIRTATYDRGGLLMPGYTLAYNGTGRAEPVTAMARGGRLKPARGKFPTGSRFKPAEGRFTTGGASTSAAARAKAGASLLGGLNSGVWRDAGKINSWFSSLVKQIKASFWGTTEKKMLTWVSGIQKAFATAQAKAAGIAAQIAAAKEYAGTVTSAAKEFAQLSGLSNKNSSYNIGAGLRDRAASLTTFADQIIKLKGRGLANGLLQQIIGMGAAEGSSVASAILGGSQGELQAINAAQTRIDKAASSLGLTAADALYDSGRGAGRGFLTGLYDQQAALDREMDRLGKRLADGVRKSFAVKPAAKPKPAPKPPLKPAKGKFPTKRLIPATGKLYDRGGMLQPGVTLAVNATRKPEPVFTSLKAAAEFGGDGAQAVPLVGEVHVHHVPGYSTPADVQRALRHAELTARSHRRR